MVSTPAPAGSISLQRKCACGGTPGVSGECEECRRKRTGLVQRKALGAQGPALAPASVHDVLGSPGRPLDRATRASMETRFGHDFSRVRIHTDMRAAESARAVSALAYTVGADIVFGAERYAPETAAGRRLLVHELAHVRQQDRAAPSGLGKLVIGDSHSAEEQAADRVAEAAVDTSTLGLSLGLAPASVPVLRRQEEDAITQAGLAPGTEHPFTSNGVKVIIFRRCEPAEYGVDKIQKATEAALDAIFKTECISSDRRAILQKNLVKYGVHIFCKQPGEMTNGPDTCAENPPGTGQIQLSSIAFDQNSNFNQKCNDLRAVILHELIHAGLFAQFEKLPQSCENSCFGKVRDEGPELCQNPRQPGTMD